MKRIVFYIILLLTLSVSLPAFATVNVFSAISTNTTWTAANSPYIILNDSVVVNPGITLTIQAGVTIKFNAGKRIVVSGNITANGSNANNIIFTSNVATPAPGNWDGLLLNSNAQVTFNYVKFMYATTGISFALNSTSTVIIIRTSRFEKNLKGFSSAGGNTMSGLIDSCVFFDNAIAIDRVGNGLLQISNSTFMRNGTGLRSLVNGAVVSNSSFCGNTGTGIERAKKISGCKITGNATGIEFAIDTITACTIAYNGIGINYADSLSPVALMHAFNNVIYKNTLHVKNNSGNNLVMRLNCWGTTDTMQLQPLIYDGSDSLPLGLVFVAPVTVCDSSVVSTLKTPCDADTITASVVGSLLCKGDSISVVYKINGAANSGNVFTVQLSTASGSFASPLALGSKSATVSDTIRVFVPLSLLADSSYRIRVIASNPSITGLNNGINLTVKNMPAATITPAGTINLCTGDSITINASTGTGLAYSWYRNNALISGATLPALRVGQAGSYLATVSNGCVATSLPVLVNINPYPGAAITFSGDSTLCLGDSVVLHANTGSGYNYTWYKDTVPVSGATSSTYKTGSQGSYKVRINNGCISVSAPVSITTFAAPAAVISQGSHSFCVGDSLVLNANTGAGLNYAWYKDSVVINGATAPALKIYTGGSYKVSVSNGCKVFSAPFAVVVNPLPPASLTYGAMAFCAGDSTILTTDTGSGLSYTWYRDLVALSGASASTLGVYTSGNYRVKVSNACQAYSPTVSITANPLPATPAITVWGSNTFCQGDSAMLITNAGSATHVYRWYNDTLLVSSGNVQQKVVNSGTWLVRVTDSLGCKAASLPVAITVNPLPAALISYTGNTTFCQGDSLSLNANSGSGLSYNWYKDTAATGITLPVYKAFTQGSYTLRVRNGNNCSKTSAPVNITVDTKPPAVITYAGKSSFCQGDSILLNANTGSGFTYTWMKDTTLLSGATSSQLYVKTGGDYAVRVSNASTCKTIALPVRAVSNPLPALPVIGFTGSLTFCAGDSVTMTTTPAAGLRYAWYKDTSVIAGAVAPAYTARTSANYKLIVSNDSGCTSSSVTIHVLANSLPVAQLTYVGNDTICSGDSLLLLAGTTNIKQFNWFRNAVSFTQSSSSVYVKLGGNYTLDVTDSAGCHASSAGSLVVVKALPPQPVITNLGDSLFCKGDSTLLRSALQNGIAYRWYNSSIQVGSANDSSYTVHTSGDYRIEASNGCSLFSETKHITVNPQPAKPVITRNGDTLLSSAISGNQWLTWTENVIPGETANVFLPALNGGYKVRVINAFGCSNISEREQFYFAALPTINNVITEVYPNPTEEDLFTVLNLGNNEVINIHIYDMQGRLALMQNIAYTPGIPIETNISSLAAGTYTLHLKTKTGLFSVTKFIKLSNR